MSHTTHRSAPSGRAGGLVGLVVALILSGCGAAASDGGGAGGAVAAGGSGGSRTSGSGGAVGATTGGASGAGTGGAAGSSGGAAGESSSGGAGGGGVLGGAAAPGDTAAPDDTGAPPVDPPASGMGPNVDRSDNKMRSFNFKASEADPAATRLLGTEQAFVDTRVAPRGVLVVHLHGSGEKVVCGYTEHGQLLASWGFHVFMPCYDAAVSWNNSGCGAAVGDCRLEMLDGTDHSAKLNIAASESVEGRMVKALAYLVKTDPKGDWGYYLDGDKPRWPRIIISGQSFGASSALLIGKHREVVRAIALSGPFDGGAAWLKAPSVTPVERMFSFSHVNDGQHPTHVASCAAMGLPGTPVEVEKSMPPYNDSHRLTGGLTTFGGAQIDGHNATEARMQSPKDPTTGKYLYEPVWRYMYGLPPAP